MKPEGLYWVGVDWADEHHDVCVVDSQGTRQSLFRVEHSPEGLAEIVRRLQQYPQVGGVAIETSQGLAVQALLQAGLRVYAVNPKMAKRWRESRDIAGNKSDPKDSESLAVGLSHHHAHLRVLEPDDEATRELALLCEDEMSLIAERTALVNRLQSVLKTYFPAAHKWFDDWASPSAWDFVLTFPTPEALAKATRKKILGFLRVHRIGLSPVWQQRVKNRKRATDWHVDEAILKTKSFLAVTLAKQLRTLQAGLKQYRKRIKKQFAEHPDHALYESLPGAGEKLAPRILCMMGANRDRYEAAQSVQALSGTVPVTKSSGKRSGKKRHVHMRWACNKKFRQTMHLFALQTINESGWSRAYYDAACARGQNYALALRNLASKWLKIIFRMWVDRNPYDESEYEQSLKQHGSPFAEPPALLKKSG